MTASEPLQLASFLTAIEVDGTPLADPTFIRHIAAGEVLAAHEALRQAIPRLRHVRSLMDAVGDTDGHEVVTAVIRACREAITDARSLTLTVTVIDAVKAWSQAPMPRHRLTRSVLASRSSN